jgi:hypothetical protein
VTRTSILIGAIGAAVGLGAYTALNSGGSSSGTSGGDGGGPPINRIPVLRFHF